MEGYYLMRQTAVVTMLVQGHLSSRIHLKYGPEFPYWRNQIQQILHWGIPIICINASIFMTI